MTYTFGQFLNDLPLWGFKSFWYHLNESLDVFICTFVPDGEVYSDETGVWQNQVCECGRTKREAVL